MKVEVFCILVYPVTTVARYGSTVASNGTTVARYSTTVARNGTTVTSYGSTVPRYSTTVTRNGSTVLYDFYFLDASFSITGHRRSPLQVKVFLVCYF